MRWLLIACCTLHAFSSPVVEGRLTGQIGNQMFVIAAATSHALDLNATPVFPDLLSDKTNNIPFNYKTVFYHLNTTSSRIKYEYHAGMRR